MSSKYCPPRVANPWMWRVKRSVHFMLTCIVFGLRRKCQSELLQLHLAFCLFLIRDKQSEGAFPGSAEEASSSGDLALYSPLKVVIYVALMCVMLVLMYFFYKWLGKSPPSQVWTVNEAVQLLSTLMVLTPVFLFQFMLSSSSSVWPQPRPCTAVWTPYWIRLGVEHAGEINYSLTLYVKLYCNLKLHKHRSFCPHLKSEIMFLWYSMRFFFLATARMCCMIMSFFFTGHTDIHLRQKLFFPIQLLGVHC